MKSSEKNQIRKKKSSTPLSFDDQGPSTSKRLRVSTNENLTRAGIIKRMVLKNFMCHSLLEVEFNSNISIVIGRNGSGKSAILTALIIGLGGKATLTNRGSSIKGFVKAGRNSGSVEIDIYNGGAMSYRPAVYGSKITIKRTINSGGSSSYRIQSEAVLKENAACLLNEKAQLKEAIEVQSRPQFDVQKTLEELKQNLNEKRKQKQLLLTSMESKQKDLQVLQTEINNANENTTRFEEERKARLRNISEMRNQLKELDDRLKTISNDKYQLKCDVSRNEQKSQQLRSEIHEIDSRIMNEKNSLNALNSESENALLLYGRDMPRVKQMIQQCKNKFRHLPRGPLGSYMRLKDEKWALAAESYLGARMLASFAVDNHEDGTQLKEIFRRVMTGGNTPTIITSKFITQKHNVRANLVHAPHDCASLYDILEIEDAVVSNCIVDQMSTESILLVSNDNRAMQLMSNRTYVPQNCTQSVTVSGDKYYPDPNYKTYASQTKRAMYLQADVKNRIEQIQILINSLYQEKSVSTERRKSVENDIAEQGLQIRKLEDKHQKLNEMNVKIRRELSQLKNTGEPEIVNVQYLESELNEINKEILTKKSDVSRIQEESDAIKNLIEENNDKLKTLKDSTKNLEDRLNFLEGEIKEQSIKQKELSTSEPFDQKQLRTLQAQLSEAAVAKDMKLVNLQRYMEQSSTFGERHLGKRIVPKILEEIAVLERSIRRLETVTEDVELIQEKYQHLVDKYKLADEIMCRLDEDVSELRLAIDKRKRHYVLTQEYFITLIKHSFKKIMDVRQFQGSIELNVLDKKLDLVVIPQQGSQGLTNASNLSGGERSFSTIAFLYSLWQCMEFPFYILDEFDVYMDKMNRTKVIDILIRHAESHPHLQYVFLTPQDVSFIDGNVSILRFTRTRGITSLMDLSELMYQEFLNAFEDDPRHHPKIKYLSSRKKPRQYMTRIV